MKYDLGQRIRELRDQRNMSQKRLAATIGVSSSRLSNWEQGLNRPDANNLSAICRALDVSADALLGLKPLPPAPPSARPTISEREWSYVRKYRSISEHGRQLIDLLLTFEYDQARRAGHMPARVRLMLMDEPVSAGAGNYLSDGAPGSPMTLVRNRYTAEATFAVRVQGDSMEPRFHDGDLLLVGQSEVVFGEIGVFILNGQSFMKRLGKDRLISDNPAYDDIPIHEFDDLRCVGRLIGSIDPSWVVQ
jgi:phage repressor protein C with HTH and peptisase S24 domain